MRIAMLGGDGRMPYAAATLRGWGHEVRLSACEGVSLSPRDLAEAEAVVLPHPLSRDGVHLCAPTSPLAVPLATLLSMLPEGVPLVCGHADGAIAGRAGVLEYGSDARFLERSSTLTAEGGISLLLGRRPSALCDTPCLILGSGRLAGALSDLLSGLHVPVTVMARRSLGPLAGGHIPLPLAELPARIADFPILINTIPAPILTPPILTNAARGSILLELSAVPRVVDTDLLLALGIEYIAAPALPGRYAPKSAGEAVAEVVARLLSQLTR